MKVKSESEVAQLCLTPTAPWTVAHQALLSMGFSRQEYWSGVPLPSLMSYSIGWIYSSHHDGQLDYLQTLDIRKLL